MIHLAGDKPVKRALEEIALFEEEGIDGAVVENYHGSVRDVLKTLKEIYQRKTSVIIGVNILPNEFYHSLPLAFEYGADFIQLDNIAGSYQSGTLDFETYKSYKEKYSDIIVLGGVWPKYYHPIEGSDLEADLQEGKKRAEAIVVTGEGTGKVTPFEKIIGFRQILGKHPLVIGAGLTPKNAYEQLCMANGAIVGTAFKVDDNTYNPMDRNRIKDFMSVVKEARKHQEKTASK
jgi:predicted TIM-barrel enzyme